MKKIIILVLLYSVVAFGAMQYEDIPKDHWAYNSINTLVEKGVIEEDTYTFKGENYVKRYDFAYTLGKLLNKVELEKANKEDLVVLESLVSEFSVELTKIGFDTETFNSKIENLNETIQLMKTTIEKQQKQIDELTKKVDKLEEES